MRNLQAVLHPVLIAETRDADAEQGIWCTLVFVSIGDTPGIVAHVLLCCNLYSMHACYSDQTEWCSG